MFRNRTFLLILTLSLLLLTLTYGLVSFQYDRGWKKLKKHVIQRYTHGVVQNETGHAIRVTDYRTIHTVPPGKTSLQVGLWDADSIVIDRRTKIEDVIYESGVFKFCDLGYLRIQERAGYDEVLPNRRAFFCHLLNDFHHSPSIRAAFKSP